VNAVCYHGFHWAIIRKERVSSGFGTRTGIGKGGTMGGVQTSLQQQGFGENTGVLWGYVSLGLH
jgi:hypothetical protein